MMEKNNMVLILSGKYRIGTTKERSSKMVALLPMSIFMIMLVFSWHSEAETLIDTDFGIANSEVQVIDEGKKLRVTGMLPDGWSDNSSWASVKAEYIPMKEDDLNFLRVNIKEITEGRCQISYRPLPDMVRAVPLGEGFLDLDAFFGGLRDGGFDGYVAYEMCSPLRGGGSEANLDRTAQASLQEIKRLIGG